MLVSLGAGGGHAKLHEGLGVRIWVGLLLGKQPSGEQDLRVGV